MLAELKAIRRAVDIDPQIHFLEVEVFFLMEKYVLSGEFYTLAEWSKLYDKLNSQYFPLSVLR